MKPAERPSMSEIVRVMTSLSKVESPLLQYALCQFDVKFILPYCNKDSCISSTGPVVVENKLHYVNIDNLTTLTNGSMF